jgi:hypothetical protein
VSFGSSLAIYLSANHSEVVPGSLIFIIDTAWVSAAYAGTITPRLTAETAGAVAAFVGSVVFFIGLTAGLLGALVLAVGVAVGAVAIGVTRSRIVFTIVGIAALVSYVPWLASAILGPSIAAPFVVAVTAMTLALWATRRTKKS